MLDRERDRGRINERIRAIEGKIEDDKGGEGARDRGRGRARLEGGTKEEKEGDRLRNENVKGFLHRS
jgi:hypothetical protein